MAPAREIVAAGAVVRRKGPEVLLVHRPKYDDWSFPKGKLDPGEHRTTAAVREVAEETGLDVQLGPPLPLQRYWTSAGDKVVHYWVGRVVGSDDVSGYVPNAEIDQVAWFPLDTAKRMLTYDRDREVLEHFREVRRRTTPLVVLRHGRARPRKAWRGDDRERPLADEGVVQAEQLVPVLGAYGVRRVLTSTSRRCWTTVAPYAEVQRLQVELSDHLSEEQAETRGVERELHRLLERPEAAVVCTHRPVLPLVYDALGVPNPGLRPGAMLVVHHRAGQVVAVEHHEL